MLKEDVVKNFAVAYWVTSREKCRRSTSRAQSVQRAIFDFFKCFYVHF